jgi:hypothetical protein
MGDALPPSFGFGKPRSMQIFEFAIKDRAGKVHYLTIPLPYGSGGLPVHKNLRDEYWVGVKMHNEFAAMAKLHGITLPRTFVLNEGNEVIGTGHYEDFNDAYDRAYLDCMMREFAFAEYGRMASVGFSIDLPDEAVRELVERTGTSSKTILLPEEEEG